MAAWLLGYYFLLEQFCRCQYMKFEDSLESCFGEGRDGLSLFVVNSSLNQWVRQLQSSC